MIPAAPVWRFAQSSFFITIVLVLLLVLDFPYSLTGSVFAEQFEDEDESENEDDCKSYSTELRHKTGTGNNAVNDVGLISLPGKHGHIALAVMISDSKLPTADQERAVADVAKAVYEGWAQGREQARASR